MQKLLIYMVFFATLISGCSVHKLEIQQGNIITAEMLENIEPGMTADQVRFVLGTPQLVDPFRSNRWDYIYSLSQGGVISEQRHLVLIFEDGVLSTIEQR